MARRPDRRVSGAIAESGGRADRKTREPPAGLLYSPPAALAYPAQDLRAVAAPSLMNHVARDPGDHDAARSRRSSEISAPCTGHKIGGDTHQRYRESTRPKIRTAGFSRAIAGNRQNIVETHATNRPRRHLDRGAEGMCWWQAALRCSRYSGHRQQRLWPAAIHGKDYRRPKAAPGRLQQEARSA